MPKFLRQWLLSLSVEENEALFDWLDDVEAPEQDMLDALGEAWQAAQGCKRPKKPSPYRKPVRGGK